MYRSGYPEHLWTGSRVEFQAMLAVEYSLAAYSAGCHSIIQAPCMLSDAAVKVAGRLRGRTLLVLPEDKCHGVEGAVAYGANLRGLAFDNCVIYVSQPRVDLAEYLRTAIKPRLPLTGSVIVLADTLNASSRECWYLSDELNNVAVMDIGLAGFEPVEVENAICHMGAAVFNRFISGCRY